MLQTLKNYYHLIQAVAANLIYGYPSRRLKVIGVTGTDGKTTTTSLTYHILLAAGKKASMVSSVYAKIGEKVYDTGFHVTSPSAFHIQEYLKKSADNNDEFFVLETTSHGIDQNRVWGVQYEASVITNITHEHLDYHKTYESYTRVKSRLLAMSQIAIANADDQSIEALRQHSGKQLVTYGIKNKADYALDISSKLNLSLPDFNNYNYLAAFAVCRELGIEEQVILKALLSFRLPAGRVDIVAVEPVTTIVDFAHTPNSLDKILPFVRAQYLKPRGRLIHVFGSAAKRDISKRPVMGRASGAHADLVILTEEDYRDEDPEKISGEIAIGLEEKGFQKVSAEKFGSSSKQYISIVDRGEAVKKAFAISKPGDVLVFTGKGHEKSLCRGAKEYPWDDRKATLEAFKKRYP